MSVENGRPPDPAFSILCTAYLTELYLAETIESVRVQTRGDWELVVVDNGCSDEIARLVRWYAFDPRIRLVRQENRGIAGGVDAAARVAHGRYFSVLHSDDQIRPDFCARMGAVLDARPEIDALGCDAYVFVDGEDHDLPGGFRRHVGARGTPTLDHRVTLTELIGGQFIYGTGAVRRQVWEAIGGFATETPKVGDLSLWLRLLGAGFDVRVLPERLGRYRLRSDSESRDAAGVESFEEAMEQALTTATRQSGKPEDYAALHRTLRHQHYFQALRRARWAFLDGNLTVARAQSARAFRLCPTLRSAAVVCGLAVAPSALRRVHPVKQRLARVVRTARVRGPRLGALSRHPARIVEPVHVDRTSPQAFPNGTRRDPDPSAPAFSILCTAYRTEPYLAETIESVLAQTRGDWELVVVDNGRSDEIARIVRSYASDSRIRLVRQENRGVAGGVQAAARAARGRYLSVLNSDDQITPGYCARIGAILDAHPEIDAVTCDAYLFADPGEDEPPRTFLKSIKARRLAVPQRRITLAEYARRQHLYHGGTFRRSAWDRVGGYVHGIPETEDLSPDLSLWLRLLTAGCDVRLIPDVLARERIQPTSTSRNPRSAELVESCAERALLVAADAAGRPEDVDAIAAALARLRSQQAWRRARHAFLDGDLTTARCSAAVGFRQRRTFRGGAILAGLTVAPSALRRLHPVKQWVSAQATRLARTARRVVGPRVR